MYWYLEKDRPNKEISRIRKMEKSGEFEKLKKNQQIDIVRSMQTWMAAKGRYLFDPNPKERKYFLQPHFVKAISGGNRSGKTATNTIDIIMQLEGWHPLQKENLITLSENALEGWVRDHCKKLLDDGFWINSPPVKSRVVAIDFPNYVEKIIGLEVEKWMTQDYVDPKDVAYENQNKRIIKWKKDSPAKGGFLEFMTQMQPLKAHGGAARDAIWVDEELAQEYWVENAMRVISVNGRMLYGATAIEGIGWTEEAIFQPAEQGSEEAYFMEMSTYDNPINSQKVINKILSQCIDETDVDIRIHGKRKRKGGNVYKMAKDEKPWIIERFQIPKDKGIVILALDPHPQIEHAGLWMWVDYDGLYHDLIDEKPNMYEIAEFFENGTPESIKYFIEMAEMQIGRKHDFFIADPWIWNTEQIRPEEKNLASQLEDLGLYPQKGSKDRTANTLRIGQLLSLTHKDITDEEKVKSLVNPSIVLTKYPDAHPRLMTFSDLERIRYERRNWHYPVYKGNAVSEHDKIKAKPVDKDDHMMENEGRMGAFVEDYDADEFIMTSDDPAGKQPVMYTSDGKEVDVEWEDEDGRDSINNF